MKSYLSREVIKMLKDDGWYEVNVEGSHHQFKHPTKKGRTTIKHPDMEEDYYENDRTLLFSGGVFL